MAEKHWKIILTVCLMNICYVSSTLNVFTNPTYVLKPTKVNVYVACVPQPKTSDVVIKWEKDSKEIPLYPANGKLLSDTYVFSNNTLFIKNLKRRQTGTYRCNAFANANRQFTTVKVEIAYLQKVEPIATVKLFKNSNAEIVCKEPLGNPSPSLLWEKDGKTLIKDGRIDPSGWTLKINSLKDSDAGSYTCVAKNTAKRRTAVAQLEVVDPGEGILVTPEHHEILEKNSASFSCASKAVPPLPIEWKKVKLTCPGSKTLNCAIVTKENVDIIQNERIRIDGTTLYFTNALPQDKGSYKCYSKLGTQIDSKIAKLNVVEYLKVNKLTHLSQQTKDIHRNKDTKITCNFRGDGKYNIEWHQNGSVALPDNMKENNNSLDITNLTFADAGWYKCTARGLFNTVSTYVELVVYETLTFTLRPKNVTAYVGESVWIDCKGKGTPVPRINYFRDVRGGGLLNESHFVTLPNHTLYIKKLKKEDAGKYLCWLTHHYGTTTSAFELFVKVHDEHLKSYASPMGRTVAIAVGCAGVYILLVIGLMIYCRTRRAHFLRKGIISELEDGEFAKDPLMGDDAIPLENGKCLDRWQFPRKGIDEIVNLGYGKMGRVFKAHANGITNTKQSLVAVKEFDNKGNEHQAEFDLEVEMFAQLNHDNVIRLLGVVTDKSPFYIITEYSEEGDLKYHLNNTYGMPEKLLLEMSYSIASGMEYLIKLRYIHRDLATRNCVVFSNNNVKVSFLSLCEDTYSNDYHLLHDIPVPLRWLSPEAIQAENYSEKSDVWSFGVTMWEVFSLGAQPYGEFENENVLHGVCKDLRLPKPATCPQAVYEVMQKCWIVDITKRPSFEELTSLIAEINLDEDQA